MKGALSNPAVMRLVADACSRKAELLRKRQPEVASRLAARASRLRVLLRGRR